MFVAIATTRHFEIIALGHDEEQVKQALLARWKEHCQKSPDVDQGYMQELIDEQSIQIVQLEPGTAITYGYD